MCAIVPVQARGGCLSTPTSTRRSIAAEILARAADIGSHAHGPHAACAGVCCGRWCEGCWWRRGTGGAASRCRLDRLGGLGAWAAGRWPDRPPRAARVPERWTLASVPVCMVHICEIPMLAVSVFTRSSMHRPRLRYHCGGLIWDFEPCAARTPARASSRRTRGPLTGSYIATRVNGVAYHCLSVHKMSIRALIVHPCRQ